MSNPNRDTRVAGSGAVATLIAKVLFVLAASQRLALVGGQASIHG
jgi:hypothetical protein